MLHPLEIPVLNFRGKVFLRAFHRDAGKRGLDQDLVAGESLEMRNRFKIPSSQITRRNRRQLAIEIKLQSLPRPRELHRDVHLSASAPSMRGVPGHDRVVAHLSHTAPIHIGGKFSVGVAQVEQDVTGFASGTLVGKKCVAMKSRVLGGGQLGMDVRVVQLHRIKAGMGMLTGVRKSGPIAGSRLLAVAGFEAHFAGPRHNEKIQKISAAGSAQVRVAESHY